MADHMIARALPAARREAKDVTFGFMAKLFALIGGSLLLMLLVARLIFPATVKDDRFAGPFPNYPAPKLQPSPAVDMAHFYAEELARLNGAGWQNQTAGVVHIPIGQAMQDVAREGIPGWPTPQQRRVAP